MILLLYTEDIMLTGSSSQLLTSIISTLGHKVEIKELGPLHYFLGLEVWSLTLVFIFLILSTDWIFLSVVTCLTTCHVVPLVESSIRWSLPLVVDVSKYRYIVGCLQYLIQILTPHTLTTCFHLKGFCITLMVTLTLDWFFIPLLVLSLYMHTQTLIALVAQILIYMSFCLLRTKFDILNR